MSKLRSSAKGQECQIRIPFLCNRNNDTVVLAHLNGGGMALKNHDLHGAWACSACHSAVDGVATAHYTKDELDLMHLQGVIRTQKEWLKLGYISVNGAHK